MNTRPAGIQVRHDMHGFYACTDQEAEHEDKSNPSVGFDGRPHFATEQEAWDELAAYLSGEKS